MKPDQHFASLSVSLPKSQRAWVENRVATGGYGNVSDYIRDLIRRDRKEQAKEELEQKLLDALRSEERIAATPEYWERKRRELVERYGKKKKRSR